MLKRRQRIPTPRARSGPPAETCTTPATTDLFKTIAALKSPEETERFFRDLCTIPELHTLAHRWEVAKLLDQGVHYADIAERTGASTATITRINSWRRFGTGGYRLLRARGKARSKGPSVPGSPTGGCAWPFRTRAASPNRLSRCCERRATSSRRTTGGC